MTDHILQKARPLTSRSCILAVFALLSSVAWSQNEAITVRFEPGCELVKGYFSFSGADVISYAWDFGDGTSSTLASPMHTFPFGEVAMVGLNIIDGDGEPASFTSQFTTQEQLEFSQIEMPNVFTPNGDGKNDEFTPLNERFLGPCAQLSIYNRYGQRIFESLGNNLRWDGRSFAGESAPDGVYFYVFTWGGGTLNSTVTLVR